jgi:hypothetical protein
MREYAGLQYQDSTYFLGTCEAIRDAGKGAFMISPGDIDPPGRAHQAITEVLGEDYLWYPVVGNHEAETEEDMAYLREYNKGGDELPCIVNKGPEGCTETMYSFDYAETHFVILNEYFDGTSDVGTDGNIVDATYDWLVKDLDVHRKKYTFVFGHEPAFPTPDMDSGRVRHRDDSLNKYLQNRDRFWELLRDRSAVAYVCGHSHNASITTIDGVAQIDAGHCKGLGDTGAPSTFVKISVQDKGCYYEFYRDDGQGGSYKLRYSGSLTEEPS